MGNIIPSTKKNKKIFVLLYLGLLKKKAAPNLFFFMGKPWHIEGKCFKWEQHMEIEDPSEKWILFFKIMKVIEYLKK